MNLVERIAVVIILLRYLRIIDEIVLTITSCFNVRMPYVQVFVQSKVTESRRSLALLHS